MTRRQPHHTGRYEHTRINPVLDLITLTPPINGFDNFICSWIYRGEKTALIDPGPAVTSPALLSALDDIGLKQLDYILLTHIHIDHAGGIGEISAAFPESPVVCHQRGLAHLADPEKLWAGTVRTLGDTGRAYGQITPVPSHRLLDAAALTSEIIQPLLTPGHAPHHVSYLTPEKILFAGETGGVRLDLGKNRFYLRPATPPPFHLETAWESLNHLLAQNPETLCYGHATWSRQAVTDLNDHKAQLLLWRDQLRRQWPAEDRDDLENHCLTHLLAQDPFLAAFPDLPPAVAQRERFFLRNSLKGFWEYLHPQKR